MPARRLHLPILVLFLSFASRGLAQTLPGYSQCLLYPEQVRDQTLADGVRLVTVLPTALDPEKPTRLIVYALPNGNTIEQTLGCRVAPGIDWHYDIQHIAAQTRKLRALDAGENIALVLAQAPKLSWPAFRAAHPDDHPARVHTILEQATRDIPPGRGLLVTLVAHSGGGGFISSFIDSADAIDPRITRIVYLDANYSYDNDKLHHGDKLVAWLRSSPQNRLMVFAYDDRNITLDGNKVITSDTGGTFRATHRMLDFFSKHTTFAESTAGLFDVFRSADHHIAIYIHPNPDNKILHTAMIGDMNAYLEALTVGTPLENKWGTLGGPRAYTNYIQGAPGLTRAPAATRPTTRRAERPPLATQHPLSTLPVRRPDASGASDLIKELASTAVPEREQRFVAEVTAGNVPAWYRDFKRITLTGMLSDGATHSITLDVAPDYLAVGSDSDFLRLCLLPATAERIALALDCQLPTRKLVDAIYHDAELQLPPVPLIEHREALDTFVRHNALIEFQRGRFPLGLLTAGIKKDIVLTNRLKERPNRVAIYGWHEIDGKPIQPLTTVHKDTYTDYSHGTRLISRHTTVDGKPMLYEDVLRHPVLSELISDEGPMDGPWYAPSTPTSNEHP